MTCALCGDTLDDAPVVCTEGRHRPVTTVVCMRCSLCQMHPRPSAEEVTRYYASGEYYASRADTVLITGDGRQYQQHDPEYETICGMRYMTQAQDIIRALELKAGDRVLEVGAGDGSVAVLVSQMSGATVDVVEASDAMRARCEERGLVARSTLTGIVGYTHAYALHVIEHHHDPIGELAALRAVMEPGGKLFARVPNLLGATGSMAGWLDEAHLQHFTDATMVATLKRAGWDATFCEGGEHKEITVIAEASTPMAITPRVDAGEIVEFVNERVRVGKREQLDAEMGTLLVGFMRSDAVPADVKAAFDYSVGKQRQLVRAYTGARDGIASMVRAFDGEVDACETEHEDEAIRLASVVRAKAFSSAGATAGHLLNWCVMRETE